MRITTAEPSAAALLPGRLCLRVLNIYSWAAAFFGAFALYFSAHQIPAITDSFVLWFNAGMVLVQLCTAVARTLPFAVRYGVLACTLVVMTVTTSISVGPGPNWFLFVFLLLTSATLFFGPRAGLFTLIGIVLAFSTIAWGWVHGWLPVLVPSSDAAAGLYDFRAPEPWLRVLIGGVVFLAAVLLVMRNVLRDLHGAVRQSMENLRALAAEQEQRAQALEALRASEERFSKVFRFSPDAISVADFETGRYLDVNEGFERLFGYRREEMIGRTASEVGHWVDPQERARLLALLHQHGQVRGFHAFGKRSDGSHRIFDVSAQLVEIAGRRALIVAGADITDRLAAESALRESEAKFSKVFRASPVPILISDFESGRIIDANDAFLRTYDTTREQAIGRTTLELDLWRNPSDRERLTATLRAGGQVRDFRIEERTTTGRPLTALLNCEIIDLGERLAILTMVRDITAQENAAAALRESEEKFSKAFRAGPDAMSIAEVGDGRYVDVNEGFERLFGFTRAEVLGRTSLELGIWRSAAERAAFVERLGREGAVRDLEFTSVNRRGETITYQLSAECMELAGRKCVVGIVHDITDRKRAESEHARAVIRELEAREKFTRQLLAAQEAERRRIAGELHDSLGQNLLLIKNRAALALASGEVPDNARWQFESIADLAGGAIAEVRQLSHDLRPYQLDQLGLTRALEGVIDGAARNTGFAFERRLDLVDDLFSPEEATHLFRIVQESINNILKHARAHSAKIALERDLHEVVLRVEDDGAGFTPAGGRNGGMGLQNIAERVRILGGTLQIDSTPGHGTRLAIAVPTAAVPPAA